jgi:hypothetical protein
MKIELKKISFSEAMSEETNAFTADLYINGKKVGYCKNTGQGGCTDYNAYNPEDRKTIADAEAYCKTLPKVKWNNMEFDQSLESVIDQLLEDYLTAKERKKLEKRMETGILWGKPNAGTYTYLNYKIPLVGLSKTAPKMLQDRINQIKRDHCTGGVQILNTNLEALGLSV